MTVSSIKVKVIRKPTLKLSVLPRFPANVVGSGPVTVSAQSGTYTIGFQIDAFGSIIPPAPDYPTDYLLGWNSANSTYFRVSITDLIASISLTKTQRSVTATPIVVASTDQIINCNIAATAACALPTAASRNGVPITFKDIGQATANPITLTANGAEKIDGVSTYVLNLNYQAVHAHAIQ